MEYLALGSGQNIMNAGVGSALSQGFLDMKVTSLSMFNAVIPLALAVLITISVIIWSIGKFKELAGMTYHTDIHHLARHIKETDPDFWQEIEEDVESYDEDS